jgi:hypothetical protein
LHSRRHWLAEDGTVDFAKVSCGASWPEYALQTTHCLVKSGLELPGRFDMLLHPECSYLTDAVGTSCIPYAPLLNFTPVCCVMSVSQTPPDRPYTYIVNTPLLCRAGFGNHAQLDSVSAQGMDSAALATPAAALAPAGQRSCVCRASCHWGHYGNEAAPV